MPVETLDDVLERQSAAYNSGEIGSFLDCWSEDATLFPSSAKSPIEGLPKVSRWIRSNAQIPKYTMTVIKEETSGDLGYQFCKYSGTNTNAAGQSAKISGFLTRVLRRDRSGTWKIVHAMWKDSD